MDRRLIDSLVNVGVVSRAAMQRYILRATKNKSSVLQEIYAESSDANAIAEALATYLGTTKVGAAELNPDPKALSLVAPKTADSAQVLPLFLERDTVVLAISDPHQSTELIQTLRLATGSAPRLLVAAPDLLRKAIRHFYFNEEWVGRPMAEESEVFEIDETDFSDLVAPPQPEPTPPPELERPKTHTQDVNRALEDFDAFLEASSPGSKFQSDDEWEEEYYKGQSGFVSGIGSQFGESEEELNAIHGFDLFEPSEVQLTMQELVDRHDAQIQRLQQELKVQRDVVTALVEMLQESRILNRKELSRRVKLRRDG